jgi:CubicO group peptidase (beta-lactamase class C family)
MLKLASFSFLLIIVTSCYLGNELPPDQKIWTYDNPSNVGLLENRLLLIDSSILYNQYERIAGLIIIKDDKLVFENYYDSSFRHTIVPLDKTTITLTVAAIGVAIDKGLINLDDPIYEHLPSYESIINEDIKKREITIKHLLTHRSGFSWNESIVAFFGNSENNLNQMFASSDWVQFILDQPLEADPGFRYNFNSGTGSILAKIIQNASGQRFEEFLAENIFSIIGVTSFSMGQDPSGNPDGGRGASISFLDWAKFGYLMLNEGIWNDRRVIDPNFVIESSSLQSSVSPTFNLGYGWWLFGDNFDNFLPISKDGMYYITGDIGQHMYIIPSQKMLVLINAENFFSAFNNPSLNLFLQITQSIQTN